MKPVSVEIEDIGENVWCDACGDDYTQSDEQGGFLFGSKAYCPKCAAERIASIRGYGEEHYIKAHCPEGVSFKDWVLSLRGGNNTIKTVNFE